MPALDLLEVLALGALAAGVLLWLDSVRARERALAAGRAACQREGLQFLDDTVCFERLRLARDAEGRARLLRAYSFEYSDTGDNRRPGSIVMLGHELRELRLAAP